MLNIEVVRFEAQDVITASVAAPTHTHHWKFGDSNVIGGPNNTATITCAECDSTHTVSQPVMFNKTYTWED